MSFGPVKIGKGSMGNVDWAIHDVAGATTFDKDTALVPLLRSRVQVVAENMAPAATFSVLVRPAGASAFVAYAGPLTAGQWAWVHAGGSNNGILIDALRVTFSAGGGRIILASTPEGL